MFIRNFLMSLATLLFFLGCSGSDSGGGNLTQLEVNKDNIIGSWELTSLNTNNKSLSNAKASFLDKTSPMNFFIYVTYEKDSATNHYFETNDDKSEVNYGPKTSQWQLIDGSIKQIENKEVTSDHKVISLTAQEMKLISTADDNVVVTFVLKRITKEAVQSGILELQAKQ